ncbi:thioredoxin [Luteolibacter flavescens]|uniref:Thioredoxin n=1 Tax=Luteolibacter flavescens TaxID=1859460 RepID=A0ABT3FUT5_9BACT|nr:thioredoxin [Luteolibacter flavescens]MCW1887054.1 thioredoxin [Luteolibacter flavescens]
MKLSLVASLLVLACLPGCEKAKNLVSKVRASASKSTASASATAAGPAVRDLDSAGYDSFVATPGRLVVVDFHAEWCGPCKMVGPVLESVTGEFPGKVLLGKVDVDQVQDVAKREGVRSIPDVRLFRDGKEVDRFIGAMDDTKVRALFEKHTAGIEAGKAEATPSGGSGGADPHIQPMKKDWLPPGIERR